jgi:hypothetical protein
VGDVDDDNVVDNNVEDVVVFLFDVVIDGDVDGDSAAVDDDSVNDNNFDDDVVGDVII